ncbi:MAG: diguanylate cyclase [Chitinivibrionales bacterium]|nr:diguanylate cyclase [Chitinivibrionales bacterium]
MSGHGVDGFAVLCDDRGAIVRVCNDHSGVLGDTAPGASIAGMLEPESIAQFLSTIVETKLRNASSGCEIRVRCPGRRPERFHLTGVAAAEGILLVAVRHHEELERMLESLPELCSVRMTDVRRLLEDRNDMPHDDSPLYDELTRMNNELVNMQRQLVKKNAELEQANRRISELMRTDPLTQVGNRRSLTERMEEALSFARRRGMPLGVAMCDVDHFKRINDTYGHEAGDAVLRELGALLRNSVRREDIVARYGGEEFVVAMPATSVAGVYAMAERLRKALRNKRILSDGHCVTVSFGVTESRPEDTIDSALCRADKALYRAKGTGRDRTVAFDDDTCGAATTGGDQT